MGNREPIRRSSGGRAHAAAPVKDGNRARKKRAEGTRFQFHPQEKKGVTDPVVPLGRKDGSEFGGDEWNFVIIDSIQTGESDATLLPKTRRLNSPTRLCENP